MGPDLIFFLSFPLVFYGGWVEDLMSGVVGWCILFISLCDFVIQWFHLTRKKKISRMPLNFAYKRMASNAFLLLIIVVVAEKMFPYLNQSVEFSSEKINQVLLN